jgi:hypothetical protein
MKSLLKWRMLRGKPSPSIILSDDYDELARVRGLLDIRSTIRSRRDGYSMRVSGYRNCNLAITLLDLDIDLEEPGDVTPPVFSWTNKLSIGMADRAIRRILEIGLHRVAPKD